MLPLPWSPPAAGDLNKMHNKRVQRTPAAPLTRNVGQSGIPMTFAYRRDASGIADRLYRLYSRQMQTEISACIGYPWPSESDLAPLAEPAFEPAPDDEVLRDRDPASWRELPALLEICRRSAYENRDNPSDGLPSAVPVMDFEGGIVTAMLGGEVRWMGTRLHTYGDPVEPRIRDYREFDWALPDEENVWLRRYLDAYRYFLAHAGGQFELGFNAGIIAMNFAVQLRGAERAYLDMYDEPENLRRLLDYSVLFNEYLRARVDEIAGAYNRDLYGDHPLSKYRADRQPYSSVDAYSLCAPGTLQAWGAQQLTGFNKLAGGASLHIHENSHQVIEEVVEIPGWRQVQFSDGPGYARSFEIRWELRRRMRDIPIVLLCSRDEFLRAFEKKDLPANTQYRFGVDSVSEAERIMDKVRAYEAPDCV